MTPEKKDPFVAACKKILVPSKTVYKKEFTYSGYTYEDIFELAAGLKQTLGNGGMEKSVCLCTENKAVLAASIIASLHGACNLILPYAYSIPALMELRDAAGFDIAIADHPEDVPGVEIINPHAGDLRYLNSGDIRDPDQPFLRLFTGGSTGKPRVWSKTPRNLLSEALYLCTKFNIKSQDVFLSTVPPYHIYGLLFSILLPFVARARVLPEIYTFPQEIISTINRHQATVLVSIPIHYRSLHVEDLSVFSLKKAFSSAGFLDRSDASHFLEKTGIGISEIYGSTETGGIAFRSVTEKKESWQPADSVQWRLSGSRLAVKSDFTSCEMERDADGFCITGDEVCPEDNNRFVLLGRSDGIVKIAGKRVDLLDIQNKIKTLHCVRDVVVMALPTETGRDNIVVALIAGDLSEVELRKMMMEKLDPYAVPRRIKVVQAIKRSATGKIEYRRVEQMFRDQEK
ncbi:MAG TPA: class I adenylate-forming enzyme family protein [Smithellaceae bacterium]|nr:class I adenylate-forming enzyme family protein [Smithellaceae bacterium]